MTFVTPYSLRMQEVAHGEHPCILIDDSGTPGQRAGSEYLHPDRKTWVAVLTTGSQIKEICEQIPGAIEKLEAHTGAKEFHFANIYGGKGVFRNAETHLRFAPFQFMRQIFTAYQFPVIVQTFSSDGLAEVRQRWSSHLGSFPDQVGPFDMRQQSDAALFFLLCRLRWYYANNRETFSSPAYAAIDEGFRTSGRAIRIPTFEPLLQRGCLYSVQSSIFCRYSSQISLRSASRVHSGYSRRRTEAILIICTCRSWAISVRIL